MSNVKVPNAITAAEVLVREPLWAALSELYLDDTSTSFLFVELLEMKKRSSSKASKTDWKRLRSARDKDINVSAEHPEADMHHIVRGIVRRGLHPVPPKASIALRLDADVLAWFKAQGPGYQTRINAVLRAFKDASL